VSYRTLNYAELQLAIVQGKHYENPMTTKDILLKVTEKLPPGATPVDAIYELEFRQAVEQGLAELDRGEGIPIDEVKSKIASWAGKQSSRRLPKLIFRILLAS